MNLRCDAVFEGGGVKGIGFAGAITVLQQKGYRFSHVVGTSAGAIAASLVAVGYTGEEIEQILKTVDFKKFMDKSRYGRFGIAGKILNLSLRYGIYKSDYFENWLSELLRKKNKRYFGDIKTISNQYRFQAVASDLTDNKLLVLPRDFKFFGFDPDGVEIAKAVRMSMSLPFFYEPFKLRDINGKMHLIADGGILSNYPIWLLDNGTTNLAYPTFGLKFTRDGKKRYVASKNKTENIIDYSKALIATMMEANDNYHISQTNGDLERSIMIPTLISLNGKTKTIKTADFDITEDEAEALVNNGRVAAKKFIQRWDFERWKATFR